MKKLYERYHSDRKSQRRIIGENDFTYRSMIYLIRKYVHLKDKVLDIGCGVGTIDFYLAKRGCNIVGVDISRQAILAAMKDSKNFKLNQHIKFIVKDFTKVVINEKFNVVICSEVLEHLKQDKLAVEKIIDLLIKGGVVIASSPSKRAPLYKIGVLNKFDLKVGHVRRYAEASFKKLFERAGFKVLEVNKTEGVFRNFLFVSSVGGILLRVLNKWPVSEVVTFLDNMTVPFFGESNIYLVAEKK